ncbi:hypothetical protein AA313_de0210062 [Arthrobotrys entomopaga]|nr:hypothetical protein AA313_de0210062 [Arthrobotrys entomopaga]
MMLDKFGRALGGCLVYILCFSFETKYLLDTTLANNALLIPHNQLAVASAVSLLVVQCEDQIIKIGREKLRPLDGPPPPTSFSPLLAGNILTLVNICLEGVAVYIINHFLVSYCLAYAVQHIDPTLHSQLTRVLGYDWLPIVELGILLFLATELPAVLNPALEEIYRFISGYTEKPVLGFFLGKDFEKALEEGRSNILSPNPKAGLEKSAEVCQALPLHTDQSNKIPKVPEDGQVAPTCIKVDVEVKEHLEGSSSQNSNTYQHIGTQQALPPVLPTYNDARSQEVHDTAQAITVPRSVQTLDAVQHQEQSLELSLRILYGDKQFANCILNCGAIIKVFPNVPRKNTLIKAHASHIHDKKYPDHNIKETITTLNRYANYKSFLDRFFTEHPRFYSWLNLNSMTPACPFRDRHHNPCDWKADPNDRRSLVSRYSWIRSNQHLPIFTPFY